MLGAGQALSHLHFRGELVVKTSRIISLRALALVTVALAPLSAYAQRGQPAATFAAPEDITYRKANITSEGTRMSAEVFAPKNAGTEKLPTIVMSHGWGGVARSLRAPAIVFARAGFLVLTFDYRGWGDS